MSRLQLDNGFFSVEADPIMLDDSHLPPVPEIPKEEKKEDKKYSTFVLYGVKRNGTEQRLGVFSSLEESISHMTNNEGMDWIARFTSVKVTEEYMHQGCLIVKETPAVWRLGFILQ